MRKSSERCESARTLMYWSKFLKYQFYQRRDHLLTCIDQFIDFMLVYRINTQTLQENKIEVPQNLLKQTPKEKYSAWKKNINICSYQHTRCKDFISLRNETRSNTYDNLKYSTIKKLRNSIRSLQVGNVELIVTTDRADSKSEVTLLMICYIL